MMFTLNTLAFLVNIVLAIPTTSRPSLIGETVALDYGIFTGISNATSGITYFRGIRFADPPLGELRWRAPVTPPSAHLGNVSAVSFANACIETTQRTISPGTSEDCLFGNVYIPIGTTVANRLPVMVWFHGGGFQAGNTHDAPPDLILQSSSAPMIFASFEYRLGQFGFLGGSRLKSDGNLNAGLLDQRSALRWVQRYIHLFGGDQNRVTIWGESAGAGSTMFHLLGNGGNNEGLFRAAMGDSPSLNFMPLFSETYDEEIFEQFAGFAGCGNQGSNAMSCLRSAASSELTRAGSETIDARPATLFVFAPIIDDSFLRERPVEAFRAGHFAHVPVLFGSNTNEGAHWSASLRDGSANTSMPNATEQTVINFIRGQYSNVTDASLQRAITSLYPLDEFNGSFSLQGQQMYGEGRYICTAAMITAAASQRGLKSYQFHYDNPHLGSDHGDDLQAFFQTPANSNALDLALFEAMREYWTSFVTAGHPAARSAVTWAPVSSSSGSPRALLHPGGISLENISSSLASHCTFWHSISTELHT